MMFLLKIINTLQNWSGLYGKRFTEDRMLDLDKYEGLIKEAEKRRSIAFSFKEPDRVPIHISTGGSYYSHMFGYNIRDYYLHPEVMLECQLKGFEWRLEKLKDDRTDYALYLDFGPIHEALLFDTPIERPDNTSPRIVPSLETEKDILELKIPDPSRSKGIKWLYKQYAKFMEIARKTNKRIPVAKSPRFVIHPPLSAACALMESTKFYTLMVTEPRIAQILLDKMLKAFYQLVDFFDKKEGIKTDSIYLSNDNTCFISNKMYKEQILRYDKAILERYGKKRRSMHTDGPSDHNFKTFADILKLNFMDIGGWSSIDAAVREMKGKVVIHGTLNCKDLYGHDNLTEKIKEKIDHAIEIGAPGGGYEFGLGGETYIGTSPNLLVEIVNYVKEKGRYPV